MTKQNNKESFSLIDAIVHLQIAVRCNMMLTESDREAIKVVLQAFEESPGSKIKSSI